MRIVEFTKAGPFASDNARHATLHIICKAMIRRFRDRRTEALHRGEHVPAFQAIRAVALRKLDMLDAAADLRDLRSPPGNRLEALQGDRTGQYSIRINDQWRICFVWYDGRAEDVEIVDYH